MFFVRSFYDPGAGVRQAVDVWGYAYIRCDGCGRRLKIMLGQKTRTCPYCNKRVETAGKPKEPAK